MNPYLPFYIPGNNGFAGKKERPKPKRKKGRQPVDPYADKPGVPRNNPAWTDVPSVGPIPPGGYTIGPPRPKTTGGRPLPYNLPLHPGPGNDMHGRSGFLIHGGSEDGDPSEGCIVLPRDFREKIWESGDHDLVVIE